MALLTKEQIWAADDLKWEDVQVPEWGGAVRVKTLTGAERDQYEADSVKMEGNRRKMVGNLRARLVALCVINEDGTPMFTRADVMKLGQKSAPALDRVFEVAARLNAMSDEDMDDLAGNSEGGQNESSISD